jgi:hypothetical protein
MWKHGRHLLYQTSKLGNQAKVVVLHQKIVMRYASSHDTLTMNGTEFLPKLTTSLAEWVSGKSVPESALSAGCSEPEFVSDDVGFIDVVRYEVVDGVPQLRGYTEERGFF